MTSFVDWLCYVDINNIIYTLIILYNIFFLYNIYNYNKTDKEMKWPTVYKNEHLK